MTRSWSAVNSDASWLTLNMLCQRLGCLTTDWYVFKNVKIARQWSYESSNWKYKLATTVTRLPTKVTRLNHTVVLHSGNSPWPHHKWLMEYILRTYLLNIYWMRGRQPQLCWLDYCYTQCITVSKPTKHTEILCFLWSNELRERWVFICLTHAEQTSMMFSVSNCITTRKNPISTDPIELRLLHNWATTLSTEMQLYPDLWQVVKWP